MKMIKHHFRLHNIFIFICYHNKLHKLSSCYELFLNSDLSFFSILKRNQYTINNKITILCEKTASQWLGMTYISDLEIVKKELEQLKEKGVYPQRLWE